MTSEIPLKPMKSDEQISLTYRIVAYTHFSIFQVYITRLTL